MPSWIQLVLMITQYYAACWRTATLSHFLITPHIWLCPCHLTFLSLPSCLKFPCFLIPSSSTPCLLSSYLLLFLSCFLDFRLLVSLSRRFLFFCIIDSLYFVPFSPCLDPISFALVPCLLFLSHVFLSPCFLVTSSRFLLIYWLLLSCLFFVSPFFLTVMGTKLILFNYTNYFSTKIKTSLTKAGTDFG